jgi:superfamily II DNA/RNA helicase
MKAFDLHHSIVEDYKGYLQSFTNIKDERVKAEVDKAFQQGIFLPEPLVQFNPSFEAGESIDHLISEGIFHPDVKKIFGSFNLYKHQVEAIKKGSKGKSFVVTSGTGSGKSLTYLASIFDHILKAEKKKGIKAILVYPMNALINSQEEEIKKYEQNFGEDFPITFGKYTGQESGDKRAELESKKPDIILTNYMMLELIMTRNGERWIRDSLKENLKFIVFDELHTYRGRQGSDVSMLIRRINRLAKRDLVCIGTSATMASGGESQERKLAVAEVATRIFSKAFASENIVEEYLDTCTKFTGTLPQESEIKQAIQAEVNPEDEPSRFLENPLAIWLENKIALNRKSDGLIERNRPLTLSSISKQLAEDSGVELDKCQAALLGLLKWSEVLNLKGSKLKPRKAYLPFKIHQFISQTGNVFVTLEPRDEREITLETGRYIIKHGKDRPIFPVMFSRYSGYDFICVAKNFDDGKLEPRNPDELPARITREDLKGDREEGLPKRILDEKDFPDGYLILNHGSEEIWDAREEENLPESWFKTSRGITKIDNYYEFRLPRKIFFDDEGHFSSEAKYRYSGWFMPAKLLFDPTSGVVFDLKTNENTKLMRLGNEGRSTATTVTSFNVIKAQNSQKIEKRNQKLLSFTDNRQDASLQAGHFNDFMMLGRLRSAIYYALKSAERNQLSIENIGEKVFASLKITEPEYAKNPSPDPTWPEPENEKAIKDYILIRLLYDLKRGWRYNTPNLEQCGLLTIQYNRLDEFCAREEFWKDLELFNNLNPKERERTVIQVLNYFRTSYAFDYYKLIDKRAETEERLRNRLDENKVWSLDAEEKIDIPYILIPRAVGETNYRTYVASIGSGSYLGKYIKRLFEKHGLKKFESSEELTKYIESFCQVLYKGHFLKPEVVKGKKLQTTGYRLRIDNVLWKLGDGKTVVGDEIRVSSFKPYENKPNDFFNAFYLQDFSAFPKPIIGREHTGQLSNEDRIDREKKFIDGDISSLFCSPTMELGIDIAELNIVHMRNVPPNPSNYAQRSGRAGRSGQAALVFTYCSSGSPHDRNYFKEKEKMVAGSVVPPKIDLSNEELLLSHLNAYMLMELGLSSLNTSVNDVLNVSDPSLAIKADISNLVNDHLDRYKAEWITEFKELTRTIPQLRETFWFNDSWLEVHASTFLKRFDNAFSRWRALYRNAEIMVNNARRIIDDPTVAGETKGSARREENIGIRQRQLLLNDERRSFGGESEFYVFRYLASEGFLPGYNFTRLPVRSFLGYRHMDQGEFISRPRFIALKEFGPQNLIYHNGGKYRVSRMQINKVDERLQSLKISRETGYAFLNDEGKGINNDPITHQELKGEDFVENWNNLVDLSESEARPQERISCEEEERMSTGYLIDQYFSFPKGIASTINAKIKEGDQELLNLIFCQSARLLQVNRKWRIKREDDGFAIGRVSGKWKKASDLETPNPDDPVENVRIFTTGSADVLYIQPISELKLSPDAVITLSFALKRAIEKRFQVEEGEVGVWLMGKGGSQNILIYEASEGSLGILSQLIENGILLRSLFEDAYKLLHFNPVTHQDERPDLPKASYDNLLSYFNQRYHDQLDRHAVQEPLRRLLNCKIDNQKGGRSLEEQYKYLLEKYDLNSSTEKPLIEFLFKNGIQLPDEAQVNIPGYFINADFVYKNDHTFTLLFCDGSVHDEQTVKDGDKHKRQLLRDAGYDVIEWHYRETKDTLIERRKDIFRKVR